jgi:ATP-binding cassette subfamily B protein
MGTINKTIRLYWRFTKVYPRDVSLGFLAVFHTAANTILTPLMLGFATSKLSNPDSTSLSFAQIIGIIVGGSIIGIACFRIAISAVNRYEIAATRDIHDYIARYILYESYDFHAKSFSGALISQSNRLAGSYVSFIDTLAFDVQRNIVMVLFSIVTLAFFDWKLALIMGVLASLGISSTTYMTRKRYPFQRKAIADNSVQTAYLSDIITNAPTVKAFASEEYELSEYGKINKKTAASTMVSWTMQLNSNNVMTSMAVLMNLSVLLYGIYSVQHGFLAVGVFIAAQLYAVRITGAFWDSSRIIRAFERAFADAHEMVEILDKPLDLVDDKSSSKLNVPKGNIRFDNVSFHYPDSDTRQNVLEGFSLDIKPGEKIGLVGKSGGGKSTITKLVLRFMDIQTGSIEIDGQNISSVTQRSLRDNIAFVPQEPLLFHRSIAENIRYGNPKATIKEVKHAARLAYADEFIDKLPKAYDTEVGERGVKLSGGQRQRIAIARALLRDSKILVLDEATSALDSESEKLIQEALWKLMENKTSIVIAHRLSTIQRMDKIVVIDNGKIKEVGTHKQLLEKDGQYAKLWAHQSGGFIED